MLLQCKSILLESVELFHFIYIWTFGDEAAGSALFSDSEQASYVGTYTYILIYIHALMIMGEAVSK